MEGKRTLSPAARRVVTAALVAATIGAPTVALAAEPADASQQATVAADSQDAPTSGTGIGASENDDLSWKVENGTLTISGKGVMKDFTRNYTEGSQWYNGDKLITTDYSTAAPWARIDDSITKVVVKEGVTSLGKYSLSGLEYVTELELPDSLTAIGDSAMTEMSALESLSIPSGVTSIGEAAFYAMDSLSSISVASGNTAYGEKDGVLYKLGTNTARTELVLYPSGKNDEEFVVPKSVKTISAGAFSFTQVKRVDISDSQITSIPGSCFSNSSVESVPGIENVTSVGKLAFRGSSLRSLTLGKCTFIGEQAFARCKSLTNVDLSGVQIIDLNAFSESGLTSLVIPSSVTNIGNGAFTQCLSLKNVTIESSVKDAKKGSWFVDDASLESVVVKADEITLPGYVFSRCSSLKVIDLSGVGSINFDYYSLAGLSEATTVYTKSSISNKSYLAGDKYKLAWAVTNGAPISEISTNGTLPEVEPEIGYEFDGWVDSKGNSVTSSVPGGEVKALYYTTSAEDGGITWSFSNGTLTIAKKNGADSAGVMRDYGANTYSSAPWSAFASKVTKVVVDKGVTHIGQYAFAGMPSLREVEVRGKLDSKASNNAFNGCELDGFKFSGDDFYIPVGLFTGMKSLNYIDCRSYNGTKVDLNSNDGSGQGAYWWYGGPANVLMLLPGKVTTVSNPNPAMGKVYFVTVDGDVSIDASAEGLDRLYADGKVLKWYTDSTHKNEVIDPASALTGQKVYYYGVLSDGKDVGEDNPVLSPFDMLSYGYKDAKLELGQMGDMSYKRASILSGPFTAEVSNGKLYIVVNEGLDAGSYDGTVRAVTDDGASHVIKFSIIVKKAAVANKAKSDVSIKYVADRSYDVSQLFEKDPNAGDATYELVDGGTGEATLDGSTLKVTKAGTIKVKMATAENTNFLSGSVETELTVEKGDAAVSARAEKDSYAGGGDAAIVVTAPQGVTVDSVATVDAKYKAVEKDGKWVVSDLPNADASYEFTVTYRGGDNYVDGSVKATVKTTRKSSGGNGGGGSVTPTPSKYDVTVSKAANGTVTADKTSAAKGDKVTVTAKAADGYRASGVTVTDASGKAVQVTANADGTYSFEMPASKVTVSATFERTSKKFSDADYSMWYGDALDFVSAKGIMGGYPNGTFGVGQSLTRYELAQLLYKYSGGADAKDAKNETGMADVADGAWYTAAANWAVRNGVVNGYPQADGSRTFGGDNAVSTEELVAIVGNLVKADTKSADASVLSKFKDPEAVDGWATQSVAWAVQSGLINGSVESDGTYIRPSGPVARERVAAIVYNAFQKGILK